ncbi:MAG: hypothetical protein H7249_20390 [Chitinophagaceae bacterium]|nr:hypothetical protein [Oligoflexus sp.]
MPASKCCVIAVFFIASPLAAEVRGLYGSECLPMDSLSETKDLLFKPETLEAVQTVYADLDCRIPAYDISYIGTYLVESGTQTLDYAYESIKLQVLDRRVAATFNQVMLCGLNTWAVGENREVAGHDCGGQLIPALGTMIFDKMKLTPKGIQLGQTSEFLDGLSPASRPIEFDPHVYSAR